MEKMVKGLAVTKLVLINGPKYTKCTKIHLSKSKIQQTKMLVTCQRLGDLFLFGLIWQ